MTASDLHRLFASTDEPDDVYRGGFMTRRPVDNRITGHVGVESVHGDIDLSVGADGGRGCGQVTLALEPHEARELSSALERAASAAGVAREKEES